MTLLVDTAVALMSRVPRWTQWTIFQNDWSNRYRQGRNRHSAFYISCTLCTVCAYPSEPACFESEPITRLGRLTQLVRYQPIKAKWDEIRGLALTIAPATRPSHIFIYLLGFLGLRHQPASTGLAPGPAAKPSGSTNCTRTLPSLIIPNHLSYPSSLVEISRTTKTSPLLVRRATSERRPRDPVDNPNSSTPRQNLYLHSS